MATLCNIVDDLNCSVNNILQRITPIDTIENTLVINSPFSVNSYIQINEVFIGGNDGVLELPENTTVGGVPLLSPQNINENYVLPEKTNIDGYRILNTNYFNFFTSTLILSFDAFYNGGFINNYRQNDGSYPGNYPFLVPKNCILTSLRFSMVVTVVSSSGSPSCAISSTTATIYTLSLSGVETNTGISVTINTPNPLLLNSRNYGEITFEYPVPKGTSVGIKVQYTGSVSTQVGISAFAVLGYKFS